MVVGGTAGTLASRASDLLTGWVGAVSHHGGNERHASISERRAVDVGEIIVDLAISPGEFELGDRTIHAGRELDGDANTRLGVRLGVAALKFGHPSVLALTN